MFTTESPSYPEGSSLFCRGEERGKFRVHLSVTEAAPVI